MLQSLRSRLTASYLAILTVILAGYSLGSYMLVREVLAWGVEEGNHHLVMPVVTSLSREGTSLSEASQELGLQQLTDDEHLEILDAHGRVLARQGRPLAPELPLAPGNATVDGQEHYRVLTVPVTRDGKLVAYVRAAHSLAVSGRALTLLAWVLASMLPLALLLAWAGGNWLSGQALRPVEEALTRERQFLRDASHELRTPLTVMQTQTELALADDGLQGPARTRVAQLLKSARKLSRLVADLLLLSREDAGAEAGRGLAFELEEVLEEELAQLQPLAAARGVKLGQAAGESETETIGEPERVAQAVRNMLDNAIRYSPTGGAVSVRLRREGEHVCLAVTNAGPGIEPMDQERVFERFHRTDAGRESNPEGTGLGLAISRAIARAHGGDLTVASRPEGPTTFTLRLPLGPEQKRA